MLGSPADEAGRFDNERQVSMRLDAPFAMMETEVTQAQWEAMMGSQPARFRGGDNPVERVSWYDAIAFANALSKAEQRTPCYVMTACQNRPGSGCNQRGTARSCEGEFRCTVQPQPACTGYRLPSEAEWEYAARAGTTQARYGRLDVIAWHDDNADNTSHPVGRKAANRWDMHDMLGNVSEWTDDGYSRAYQPRSLDPQAYADSSRMVRGGSWCESGRWARAARRGFESPEYRSSEIGFRLVRAVNAAERR
jgi:formylglycine-generating enzyme required for sulfatase activity